MHENSSSLREWVYSFSHRFLILLLNLCLFSTRLGNFLLIFSSQNGKIFIFSGVYLTWYFSCRNPTATSLSSSQDLKFYSNITSTKDVNSFTHPYHASQSCSSIVLRCKVFPHYSIFITCKHLSVVLEPLTYCKSFCSDLHRLTATQVILHIFPLLLLPVEASIRFS